tara:strand:+ start:89 stop:289 length:201 start_codon:yes stop_codon:yes gene_type:complete
MIVKIQLPLGGLPKVLIYNEDRSVMTECTVKDVEMLFNAGEAKAYCVAELINGNLEIFERAEDQEW